MCVVRDRWHPLPPGIQCQQADDARPSIRDIVVIMRAEERSVALLACCQATFMTGQVLAITVAPLVGLELASRPALATLPMSVQIIATLLTIFPASMFMGRQGRRKGFALGAVLGIAGAAVCAAGIQQRSFWGFCVGAALLGVFNSFATFYRFAAADAASVEYRGKAIAYVLAGGVVAACAGPNLAKWTINWIPRAQFAGSYLGLIGVFAVNLLASCSLDIQPPATALQARARPFIVIVRQQSFIAAALTAMLSFAAMSLIMIATPLAMYDHRHSFADAALVIQWHMLGMCVPSFFTGHLSARFGAHRAIQMGGVTLALAALVNLLNLKLWTVLGALVLLGVGWNLLFVGASTLLTGTYAADEQGKTQAANDFLVMVTTATTSFAAAPLYQSLGWVALNLVVMPLISMIFLVLWRYRPGTES
jgi:MFS family permease